jgi:hypothetical protein
MSPLAPVSLGSTGAACGLRPAEHIRQEAGLEQEQQAQGELSQHGQQLGDGFQG